MGWRDAPEVGATPAWASAPVVEPAADDAKKALAKSTPTFSMTDRNNAFTIGMGKTGDAVWEGVKQGGLGMGAILAEMLPERMKRVAHEEITKRLLEQEKRQAEKAKEYKPLADESPVATTVGEVAPLAAAPMLRLVQGAGAAAPIVNSAASAALPAAIEYGSPEERGKRAAMAGAGGAVAGGLTHAAAKIMGGVTNTLTPEARRLAALAEEKFNIPLDAAQKTGNKALQTVEAAMENMPVTSGAQALKKTAQRDAFTREVMKTLGEATEEATPATLKAAKGRMGGEFERIFGKVHVNLDDEAVQAGMGKVIQEAIDTLNPDQARIVAKRAGEIIGKVDDNGAVAGKAYQNWRSQVQAQAQKTGDEWLAKHLRDLYRVVDDAAYKAAGERGEEAALRTVRGQWKNMRTVEPLVAKSEDGIISPSLLRGQVMSKFDDFATGGGGDLGELARIGRKFVADPVPNSGTAQRQLAQSLLTGGGVGGLAYLTSGDPATAAKWAAGSVMLPKAAQKMLHSGAAQKVMAGQRPLTAIERALIERASRLSALGVAGAASE